MIQRSDVDALRGEMADLLYGSIAKVGDPDRQQDVLQWICDVWLDKSVEILRDETKPVGERTRIAGFYQLAAQEMAKGYDRYELDEKIREAKRA